MSGGRRKNHHMSATATATVEKRKGKKNEEELHRLRLHDGVLLSSDYIFDKVFRNDGPPLGVEFDSLPSQAFLHCKKGRRDCKNSHRACQESHIALKGNKAYRNCDRVCDENQRPLKRRKVSMPTLLDNQVCGKKSASINKRGIGKGLMTGIKSAPVKKHGVGKGLMTGKKSAPVKKHGVGKGLMTGKKSAPVKKHGVGKGLITGKKSAPVKKHGVGKGLMTVWRAINPDGGEFPTSVNFNEREPTSVFEMSTFASQKPLVKEKKSQKRQPATRRLGKGIKVQEKRRPPIRRKKVEGNNTKKQTQLLKEKCELALEGERCQEDLEQFALLVDDEELELRELQAGPNPLRCSAHFATNGLHGCSLCKDLLAKFPPNSVMMRLPFYVQPWSSSPELVKKLFKVFHFIYTYAVMFKISSFTLDEFAQAFSDKESMLLGKIHLDFLTLLLSDIEMECSQEFFPHGSKSGKFLELLHSVKHQHYVLEFWKKSLNPLTWTEVLRQVFIAAGFGSKHGTLRREAPSKSASQCLQLLKAAQVKKVNVPNLGCIVLTHLPVAWQEVSRMVRYGLSPDTLKGELFGILSEQGNNGMKVSDLAKSSKIMDLNLAITANELELLITSTLSSDITLFEKISCSAYRLRIHSATKEDDNFELDPEDFGSIDDHSKDTDSFSSGDDSEYDTGTSAARSKNGNNTLTVYTEIDESHPGEVWLLGLMEGEYSDLSIEEKLNALVALVDLLSSGSSIRMEDPIVPIAECVSNNHYYGSGGKIKRSSVKQNNLPFGGHSGQMLSTKELDKMSGLHPVDSSASKLCAKAKFYSQRKHAKELEVEADLHPMQSIFLGSDRRYNQYWLFLGPCNACDPGHKRIYFQSSEDGHWEVIDTEEALCTLLSALDCRGTREAHLLVSLKKREAYLCQSMCSMLNDFGIRQLNHSDQSELNISREDSSSAVSDVDNNFCLTEIRKDVPTPSVAVVLETRKKEEHQKQKWSRLQAFDAWIWNSFYSNLNAVKYSKRSYFDSLTRCECCHDLYWRDEKHCKTCHTTFELDFDLEERYAIHVATCRENGKADMFPNHKVLSSQLQVLKAAIHAIELVMPEGALVGAWTKSAHKLWIKRLRRTSSLAEFVQVVADFVDAINEEWLCQCHFDLRSNPAFQEIIESFTTMPQTLSAVALWLVKLDVLIAPNFERIHIE